MSQAVLGGGISGLAAAYYLTKSAATNIRVYESTGRLGGWIRSVKSNNGALFEVGPRTLRYDLEACQNTLKLIDELQLTSAITPVSVRDKQANIKMLYINNQLVDFPSGFRSFFLGKPPVTRPLILGLINDLRTPKKAVEDESVHDFISRRFGEDYAENIMGSVICGIFAGDAKEISVKSVLKAVFEMEQEYGSIVRGLLPYYKNKKQEVKDVQRKLWSVWSLKGGLETLPMELSEYLKNTGSVEFHLEKKCSRIRFRDGKATLTVDGNEETVDHVYSSLPSRELAKILGHEHSFLKTKLSSIPFVSVGVVNLEFAGGLLKPRGFGCLIPPNQNLPILGITFDSNIFPQEGKTVLTVMMGGKWFEQHFGSNPDEGMLLQTALDYVRKILKIEEKPVSSLVTIAKDCLPQYIVGHSRRIKEIRDYIAGKKLPLTVVGSSFDGVGVNDTILSTKKAVESRVVELSSRSS